MHSLFARGPREKRLSTLVKLSLMAPKKGYRKNGMRTLHGPETGYQEIGRRMVHGQEKGLSKTGIRALHGPEKGVSNKSLLRRFDAPKSVSTHREPLSSLSLYVSLSGPSASRSSPGRASPGLGNMKFCSHEKTIDHANPDLWKTIFEVMECLDLDCLISPFQGHGTAQS